MQAAISSHLQATAGQRLVVLASADRHIVKPWLSTRLAFSAPVPEPGPVDATLVGGRIDSLEGRSVAAVVYRQRDHIVDAFVWPTADEDTPSPRPHCADSTSVIGLAAECATAWCRTCLARNL